MSVCKTCNEFFFPGGRTREDEQKMIRDAADALRAAHQESDSAPSLETGFRRLDQGVRSALAILMRGSDQPMSEPHVVRQVRSG